MSQTITLLDDDNIAFPAVERALAEPNGLLAVGGDLSVKRLINAYKSGIFPWYSENEPLMWWSPDPRAIIPVEHIRINRTLRKFLNKELYQVTVNKAFSQVIALCADAPFRRESTWILPEMQYAYQQLHQLGVAHSIEVWCQDELVGGLYGVAINGFFSGESMFYSQPNGSKVALVYLAHLMIQHGIEFIDCQMLNPFLEDMGAVEISREKFIKIKEQAINKIIAEDFWQPRTLSLA